MPSARALMGGWVIGTTWESGGPPGFGAMRCDEFLGAIDAYFDDELSIMDILRVHRHLLSCECCYRVMGSEAALHSLLADDAAGTNRRAPSGGESSGGWPPRRVPAPPAHGPRPDPGGSRSPRSRPLWPVAFVRLPLRVPEISGNRSPADLMLHAAESGPRNVV